MSLDTHVRRGHPIFFGLLTFFSIVQLCISAWLTSMYNRHNNYPDTGVRDTTRYILFASTWTVLFAIVYLAGFLAVPLGAGGVFLSIASHLGWVILTFIFWLAGAAAITSRLGGGLSCKFSDVPYCGQLNAEEAMAWINTVWLFIILLIISGLAFRARRGGTTMGGAIV